jgi:hypothetical protein
MIASILGACAVIDPVDSRYDTVSRSLAKARNEAIFLNLVRASHDYPLSFTTIANVTPTMTNTSTFSLPNFLVGPHIAPYASGGATITAPLFTPGRDVIFNNTTASDALAIGTNFNVSTQETSAFYLGFLKPIDLQVLDYFIRQGYSRELLFWLFADTIEVKIAGHNVGMQYDPPNSYGCDRNDPKPLCFSDFILIATGAGLTVEELTLQSAGSSEKGGGGSEKGGGGGKTETTILARFCFDPVLGRRAQAEMPAQWAILGRAFDINLASPKCGSRWDSASQAKLPQPDTLNFNVGEYQFKITPRSAYGVFEFLGTIMKLQRHLIEQTGPAYIPPNRADVTVAPSIYTVAEDHDLITVLPESETPQCFVHTWFYDGDYCVPETATNTKRIFSLLAQLIAIQTAATDLSITPIVRVIQ